MKTFILILLSMRLATSHLYAADPCPVCKGEVTTVGKIKDDPSNSRKNEWVWSTSPECGPALFDGNSLICKRCWFAKQPMKPDAWWVRSTVLPDSFFIPLSAAIRNFPAPPNLANYDQKFIREHRTDSISFMCKITPEMTSKFRKYCKEHKLSLDLTEFKSGEVLVVVSKEEAQQAAPSDVEKPPK